MFARNACLLASLPALDEPGTRPPLSPASFLARLEGEGEREPVRALLLSDDLTERQAYLAGELAEPQPVVLTPAQARGESPLPQELTPAGAEHEPGPASRPAEDATWEAYFRWAAAVARRRSSPLLAAWVASEVAVRNVLADARARALGLDPEQALVAPELGRDEAAEAQVALAAWTEAQDPLRGLRALLRWRWDWIGSREPWFSFHDDEVLAYAMRLALLRRWLRSAARAPGGTP